MIMKWNPIENGDLSGIPKAKLLIFTVYDEEDEKTYVIPGWVSEYTGEVCEETVECIYTYETKNVKAWMELPESFKPGRCNMCKHWEEWTDNFGDRHSKCELFDNVPFSQIISSKSCPIDKEISDDSN